MMMRGSAVSLARVQVRRARQAYHKLPPAARGVRLVPHRGRTVVPFGRAAAVVDPAQQPRVSSVDADEKTSTSGTVSNNGPVSGRDRTRTRQQHRERRRSAQQSREQDEWYKFHLSKEDLRIVDLVVQRLDSGPVDVETCEKALLDHEEFLQAVVSRRMKLDFADARYNTKFYKKIRSSKMLSRFFRSVRNSEAAVETLNFLREQVMEWNASFNEQQQQQQGAGDGIQSAALTDPFYISKDSICVLLDRLLREGQTAHAREVCDFVKTSFERPGHMVLCFSAQVMSRTGRLQECVDEMRAALELCRRDAGGEPDMKMRRRIPKGCYSDAIMASMGVGDADSALEFAKCMLSCGYSMSDKIRSKGTKFFLEAERYDGVKLMEMPVAAAGHALSETREATGYASSSEDSDGGVNSRGGGPNQASSSPPNDTRSRRATRTAWVENPRQYFQLSRMDWDIVNRARDCVDELPDGMRADGAITSGSPDFVDAVISRGTRFLRGALLTPKDTERNGSLRQWLLRQTRASKMLSSFFSKVNSCRRAYEVFLLLDGEVLRRNAKLNRQCRGAEGDGGLSATVGKDDGDFYLPRDSLMDLVERLLRERNASKALHVCEAIKRYFDDPGLQVMFYSMQSAFLCYRVHECVDEMHSILLATEREPDARSSIPLNCFEYAVRACIDTVDPRAAFVFIRDGYGPGAAYGPGDLDVAVRARALRLFLNSESYRAIAAVVNMNLDAGLKLDNSVMTIGLQGALRSGNEQLIEKIAEAYMDGRHETLAVKTMTTAISAFASAGLWDATYAAFDATLTSREVDSVALKTFLWKLHGKGDMERVISTFEAVRTMDLDTRGDNNMYALVIDAYRSLDRYEDAFKCFLMLRDEGIVPNCRLTTATLANIYADMTSEGAGNVSQHKANVGLDRLSAVMELVNTAAVPWDAIMFAMAIQCYACCGRWFEAENLYKDMIVARIRPTPDHMRIMLIAYWKGRQVSNAMNMFEVILKRRPDAATWWTFNVMLQGYRRFNMHDEAIALFDRALALTGTTNVKAMNLMIDVYRDCGQLSKALSIFKYLMESSDTVSYYSVTAVLRCCVRGGRIDTAEAIWELVEKKREKHGGEESNECMEGCFGILLDVCRVAGNAERASHYLEEMQRRGLNANPVHYSTVMCLYFEIGDVGGAKEIFSRMVETNAIDDVAYFLFVKHLVEAGLKEEAIGLVKGMADDETIDRCHPYHALVGSLGGAGYIDEMLDIISYMQSVGVAPMARTFASAIESCTEFGRHGESESMIDQLMICSDDAKSYQYDFLLQIFWKREEFERMIGVYEMMHQRFVQPTNSIFTNVLRAAFATSRWEMVLNIHSQMIGAKMGVEEEDHRRICLAHAHLGNWMQLATYLNRLNYGIDVFDENDFVTFVERAIEEDDYNVAYELYNRAQKFNVSIPKKLRDLAVDCARRLGEWEDAKSLREEAGVGGDAGESMDYDVDVAGTHQGLDDGGQRPGRGRRQLGDNDNGDDLLDFMDSLPLDGDGGSTRINDSARDYLFQMPEDDPFVIGADS